MPPVRKRPRAEPQTRRCRYVFEDDGKRCARVATVPGGFCRSCAAIITFDLPTPVGRKLGAVDRELAQRHDPISSAFGTIMDAMFGMFSPSSPSPSRGSSGSARPDAPPPHPGSRSSPPPPPRPPPPKPNPVRAALTILGFESIDGLTVERVKQRKQALAKVFHPDLPTGSANQMRLVNQASDVILRELAKRA
jgi:hypothetical protein